MAGAFPVTYCSFHFTLALSQSANSLFTILWTCSCRDCRGVWSSVYINWKAWKGKLIFFETFFFKCNTWSTWTQNCLDFGKLQKRTMFCFFITLSWSCLFDSFDLFSQLSLKQTLPISNFDRTRLQMFCLQI